MNTPNTPAYQHAYNFAQQQVAALITRQPNFFPMYTVGGQWRHDGETWTNWCEGFLGGMLWLFHQQTGDPWWRTQAEHYSRLVEPRQHDTTVHDLGFVFWPTWKCWYDLTGDEAVQRVVITAGRTLGQRFMERGRYLRSFVAPESLFIDIMMNVGIVFYAAQQTGDEALLDRAHQHCRTTRRYLVRGDGSTAHEGLFDLETGEFLRQSTHQGWRGDSSWARGQAWALYGFGTAYALTGERAYLQTAQACADYYLERTAFDAGAPFGPGIPPNDWDEPNSPPESSAAAVAAGGLLQLARLLPGTPDAARYRSAAFTLLDTLSQPPYLASDTPGWEGILKRGIYHRRKNLGVDESVMWGEYFFVEALVWALAEADRRPSTDD